METPEKLQTTPHHCTTLIYLAYFRFFLTPVFGAWCTRHNWKALGIPERATTSLLWMLGYAGFLVIFIFVDLIPASAWLPLLIIWYYSDCREQKIFIKENNLYFRHKSILPPALIRFSE